LDVQLGIVPEVKKKAQELLSFDESEKSANTQFWGANSVLHGSNSIPKKNEKN